MASSFYFGGATCSKNEHSNAFLSASISDNSLSSIVMGLSPLLKIKVILSSYKYIKIIDVLNFYTNGKTPPKITDVSFIGDVSRQGILPDLVKYFIETSQ